jgi:hypothetical protein
LCCESIRFLGCDTIAKGGWHLSYFGSTSFIKNKLENFAHQEYNSAKYTDPNEIQKKIDNHVDLFGRDTSINVMRELEIYNNEYLPPMYNVYLRSFYSITETKRESELLRILTNEYYDSAWKGHFEFAMFLVKYMNPNVIVELGVDYGHSAFSLASSNIGTVYAIDCFEGDKLSGFKKTEGVFKRFKNTLLNKSLLLADNIVTIKGYFDNVVLTFDKTIDILHIDGLNTYESVKNDFEKWLVKTSENAIIIIHDPIAFHDTVGKFYKELQYPKFLFTHSAGLAVVCKSQEYLDNLLVALLKSGLNCVNYIRYDEKHIQNNDSISMLKAKKYCFIHSCTLDNIGTKKLDYIIDKINSSGLIDVLEKVFIYNIGLPIGNKYNLNTTHNKYELTNYSSNPLLFENPTINKVRKFAEENPDSYVLYLHTKGNSYQVEGQNIIDWTNMMLYFLVEKYNLCIHKLDIKYDTVGCNYGSKPLCHYSGNFWWAQTNYIKTLDFVNEKVPDKMVPEFWVLKNNPNKCIIHSSGINHYHELYPRIRYQLDYVFTNTWFEYSEIKRLLLDYVDKSSVNKILEIGSYEGASACYFSDNLLDNELSSITCVDSFILGDTTYLLTDNTKILFYDNIKKSKNYNKMLVEEMYSADFYNKNDIKNDIKNNKKDDKNVFEPSTVIY